MIPLDIEKNIKEIKKIWHQVYGENSSLPFFHTFLKELSEIEEACEQKNWDTALKISDQNYSWAHAQTFSADLSQAYFFDLADCFEKLSGEIKKQI